MNTALLEYSLYVDCPNCKEGLDLADSCYEDDGYPASKIFTDQWDKLKGFKICCEYCNHEFELEGVEY